MIAAGHSGTIMNGTPVFCGGDTGLGSADGRCYKLNKLNRTWEQIEDLLSPTYYAGNVLVPSKGWFIFGGVSTLTTSQWLASIDGKWQNGPDLNENRTDLYQCVTQISDTVTAFLGGNNHYRGIITFDWAKMEYTTQDSELSTFRIWSACASIKGVNGQPLVAVAGGNDAPGMEAWNPMDGSITVLTPDFPPGGRAYRTPQVVISLSNYYLGQKR